MKKRLFQLPWRSRRHIAADVDAELAFHIEARTESLVAGGMDRDAARARALADFGDLNDARRYLNSVDRQIEGNRRRQDFMRDLIQDAAYAIRQLRNHPVFAISAMVTLAVGIGANTAVLNLVNAVLLKPPAVHEPSGLAWVSPLERDGDHGQWTAPDYVTFRDAARSWSGLALIGGVDLALGGDDPIRVSGQGVSENYFDVLGVRPMLGRGFVAGTDGDATASMVVVLGHPLWRERFNGDSAIIGKTVMLNQQPLTVVGVAPQSFGGLRLGEDNDFWVPIGALSTLHARYRGMFDQPKSRWLRVVGRLAPTAELFDAQQEAALLQTRLEPHITNPDERRTLRVDALRGSVEPGGRAKMLPVLSLVMVVPLLVLAVACANVANLFVSRSVQRQRELAVRRALGASRSRIVRQLLTECAILGVAAGLLGVVFSYGLTAVIGATGQLPEDAMQMLRPDFRVLALTLALALAAGTLFGLMPVLAATAKPITPGLKSDGIALQTGRGRHRLRDTFVISQVALSLALLITAGLFVGSLRKALRVEPGFDPRNAVAVEMDLSGTGYDSARVARFMAALLEKVSATPGVESAALANFLPLSGSAWTTGITPDGPDHTARRVMSMHARVSHEYFDAMRIPITRGRAFTSEDRPTSPRVAIVNERLATLFWPGENPIGKRIRISSDAEMSVVIGVTPTGKYRRLAESSEEPYAWLSSVQYPIGEQSTLVVRGARSTEDAAYAARAALQELDASLPPFGITALEDAVARTVEGQRAGAALLGVFGALGLGLAAFGIFGVIAQGVAARRREIGIRMSLGAQARDVVLSFVREGVRLTLVGGAIGVAISLAASQVLSSLLFGLRPTDALTFAGASVVLLIVAGLASLFPARRAANVDPLEALRSD